MSSYDTDQEIHIFVTNQPESTNGPVGYHADFNENLRKNQFPAHKRQSFNQSSSVTKMRQHNSSSHLQTQNESGGAMSQYSPERYKRRIKELEEDMRIIKVSISNVLHAFCGLPNTNVSQDLIESIEKGTISALVLFLGRLVERLDVYRVQEANLEEIKGLLEDTSAMNCTLIAEKDMMKNEIIEIVESSDGYEEVKKKLVSMLNRTDSEPQSKRSLKRPSTSEKSPHKPTKSKRVRSSQLRSRHPMYEVGSRGRPLSTLSGGPALYTGRGKIDPEDVIEVSSKDGDSDDNSIAEDNMDKGKSLTKDGYRDDSSTSTSIKKDLMIDICLTQRQRKRGHYTHYDRVNKLEMARYASDHGASKTANHFTAMFGQKVSESTVRSIMQQYSKGLLNDPEEDSTNQSEDMEMSGGTPEKDQPQTNDSNRNRKTDGDASEQANDSDTSVQSSTTESLPHWSVMVSESGRRKRGRYVQYDEVMRAEIGKYALKHGVAEASRHFTEEIGRKVSESTIRTMRDQCQKLQKKGVSEISALPSCPRGAPMLLGNLDAEVQKWIQDARMHGGLINTRVVMAAADGIVMKHAKHKLKRFGGDITITKHYARSLLRRMGLEKNKNSKDSTGQLPDDFETIKSSFVSRVKNTASEDSVPNSLIINWNHLSCQLVPGQNWTQEDSDDPITSSCSVDDKRQITLILAITRSGQILPPQIIYHGKTDRCLPNGVTFPAGWDVLYSDSQFGNEDTMLRYIDNIILPFINSIRGSPLSTGKVQQAIALFDATEINNSRALFQKLEDNNISSIFIPACCKERLQPIGQGVNEKFKEIMKQQFTDWYSEEVLSTLLESGMDSVGTVIDMKTSRLKPIHAQWVIKAHLELEKQHDLIQAGFMKAGLLDNYSNTLHPDRVLSTNQTN